MQQVMTKAWEIARAGQLKFGGKVSEYLSEALRMAWSMEREMEKMKDIQTNVKVNEWKNYGKHRLYIEAEIRLVEQKEVRGNVFGVLRRIDGKWYYDFQTEEMYRQLYNERDMSTADDEVVEYMRSEIKKMIWGEVKKYA